MLFITTTLLLLLFPSIYISYTVSTRSSNPFCIVTYNEDWSLLLVHTVVYIHPTGYFIATRFMAHLRLISLWTPSGTNCCKIKIVAGKE